MNVLKGLSRDRDAEREREDLLRQIKELRDRVTVLEGDNDALIGENLVLQEQLEQERTKAYELCKQRLEEQRAHLRHVAEEERTLGETRALVALLTAEGLTDATQNPRREPHPRPPPPVTTEP